MNIWKKDDRQAWGTMGRASSTDVIWTLAVDVAWHGGDKFATSWIQSSPTQVPLNIKLLALTHVVIGLMDWVVIINLAAIFISIITVCWLERVSLRAAYGRIGSPMILLSGWASAFWGAYQATQLGHTTIAFSVLMMCGTIVILSWLVSQIVSVSSNQ